MQNIKIGNCALKVKDYYCSADGFYIRRDDCKLWLYVNVTDVCQASCPFCVNPSKKNGWNTFDIDAFKSMLNSIEQYISGISFTGGEPMLDVELLETLVSVIKENVADNIELDMVTNGANIDYLPKMKGVERFSSIHISRHMTDDEDNSKLMGFPSPTEAALMDVISRLPDKGAIVFNCVMQKGGVASREDMSAYLEMASQIGVRNTSFVGLFMANEYCKEHYISPSSIDLAKDDRFRIWNHFKDHQYCQCSSGDYLSENGYVRFYYRCPGVEAAPYIRQLVYTADNKLLTSFGGREIKTC